MVKFGSKLRALLSQSKTVGSYKNKYQLFNMYPILDGWQVSEYASVNVLNLSNLPPRWED